MMEIPVSEYQRLQDELSMLKDTELLKKLNRLVDYLYQDKYGLYLGDNTDDLTEFAVNNAWENEESAWDKV
ncbi:MAG TPA: hypothetical protein PLP07_04960 [Pyrinomonadaceae bacterium]|nr:hypothetical protein [Chloracidobacterium sp.]MBP9108964.1 hypothetical protein [Pyrinomonadaceae bacterium]MBK7801843.1 hypothetical protein [Chloracidobacterium sp.]MBK9765553.1 hypothetical protein [Chloracidobacterium sp.]MBL0242150.1 hypothetical protein [Chloracidobacterium sp.]